jgi:hypothetical protein
MARHKGIMDDSIDIKFKVDKMRIQSQKLENAWFSGGGG